MIKPYPQLIHHVESTRRARRDVRVHDEGVDVAEGGKCRRHVGEVGSFVGVASHDAVEGVGVGGAVFVEGLGPDVLGLLMLGGN